MRRLDVKTEAARKAAEVSDERLHRYRKTVIEPAKKIARENNFAALIRESLQIGYEK